MEAKNLSFPGGVILGAGIMYLLDPDRNRARTSPPTWTGLQCLAGVLGVAAFAYGARAIARLGQRDGSTTTAFDLDAPNYAWLR